MDRSYYRIAVFALAVAAGLNLPVAVAATPKTAPLEELVDYPAISASASVISLNNTLLSAQLNARVEQVVADVGAVVDKGDLLVVLDCSDYLLAEKSARAQVAAARADLLLADSQDQRIRTLAERNLASRQDADAALAGSAAAKAGVAQADVSLELARLSVSRCRITAPFPGTVTERQVSVGHLAAPGTPLLALVDTAALEVSARVSEQDMHSFSATSEFVFDGVRQHPLRLARAVNAVDPDTRTREIRLTFVDRPPPPGTAGVVRWRSLVPHLPPQYLVVRNGRTGFFVAADGKVRFETLVNAFPGRAHPVTLPLTTQVVIAGLGTLEADHSGKRTP